MCVSICLLFLTKGVMFSVNECGVILRTAGPINQLVNYNAFNARQLSKFFDDFAGDEFGGDNG